MASSRGRGGEVWKLRVEGHCLGFRVYGFGFRVHNVGFRVLLKRNVHGL